LIMATTNNANANHLNPECACNIIFFLQKYTYLDL
jgi:hypothetical protein